MESGSRPKTRVLYLISSYRLSVRQTYLSGLSTGGLFIHTLEETSMSPAGDVGFDIMLEDGETREERSVTAARKFVERKKKGN